MKDLPLSVLSRGCAQFVQSEGKQCGRLDVCFTAEDFYIWKAHGSWLRLSPSGGLLPGPETSLPKTFSTRRGALLLYSQGLATLNIYDGKDEGQCRTQPVIQEETATIQFTQSAKNYGRVNESNPVVSSTLPALYCAHSEDVKYFFLCQPELTSRLQSHCEDGQKRRIDLVLPPITADSGDDEDNQLRTSQEQIEQVGTAKLAKNNDNCKRNEEKTTVTQSSTKRPEKGGFLPSLTTAKPGNFETHKMQSHRIINEREHLPFIEERGEDTRRILSLKQSEEKLLKNTNGAQPFLPRLVQETCEEKTQKRADNLGGKQETWRLLRGQTSVNSMVLIPAEVAETCVPGFLSGRRGPGRQSSLAFLQKLSGDCRDPPSMEGVRGVLPLELRDLNGTSVGSLILGPDGEVIHLSMFDTIQQSAQGQTLEVISAKGEKLPWFVTLQPEHAETEKDMKIINTVQDHRMNKPSDLHRSGHGLEKMTNSDPGVVGNSDLQEANEVTVRQNKSPTHEEGEDIVLCLSNLEEREELKSREKPGRLSPLLQLEVSTEEPNETPSSTEDKILNNTEGESNGKTKAKGTHGGTRSNKENPKETRSNHNNQTPLGEETENRTTAHHFQPDDRKHDNTSATRGAKSNDDKTRDFSKEENNQGYYDVEDVSREREKGRERFKNKVIPSDMSPTSSTEEINNHHNVEEKVNKQRNNSKQKFGESGEVEDGETVSRKDSGLSSEKHSRSVRSLRSLRSGASPGSVLDHSSSQKSLSSSCDGGTAPGNTAGGLSRLSTCSTVTVPEERLMLNPTKPEEVAVTQRSVRDQNDTVLEMERVQMERQEEARKRKRREQEEEQRRQQQKNELEQRLKTELHNDRQRRKEEARLKKQVEEEETQRREEEEQRKERMQQERREREVRRQQERRRTMEQIQRKREEEEQRRRADTERLKQLEEERLQEENLMLQKMTVSERAEYQLKKQQENEKREKDEAEQRRREEEAALSAAEKAKVEEELLEREMVLLHQRFSFKRGLKVESEGLEMSQGISRPWTYSYFTLLQLLGEHRT
ncbi:unnamed protein product [Knipowitschia caucasica]